MILSGIVISWYREAAGGLMILIGYFFSLALKDMEGSVFYTLPLAGILFLFCWWQSGKMTLQIPH